jgi:hypothetical protein
MARDLTEPILELNGESYRLKHAKARRRPAAPAERDRATVVAADAPPAPARQPEGQAPA